MQATFVFGSFVCHRIHSIKSAIYTNLLYIIKIYKKNFFFILKYNNYKNIYINFLRKRKRERKKESSIIKLCVACLKVALSNHNDEFM